MLGMSNPAARALGLLMVFAVSAQSQAAPAKECAIDENNPQSLAKASFMVKRAQGSQDARFIAQQLSPAVKMLTDNAAAMPNQPGRNLVLGRALTLWSMQPNVPTVTTRGSLGYTTDPQGTVDLVVAIDSAFSFVEKSNPECIAETSRWRRSPAWVAMANDAVRLMNSDPDSAAIVAGRAVKLNPYAPYAFMVLAYAARQKDSTGVALAYYRKANDMAQYDTSFAEVGAQSLSLLAEAAVEAAESMDTTNATANATRREYLAQAQAALQQLQKDTKYAAQYAASSRSEMCRLSIALGDTASLRRDYADALANPGKLSFNEAVDAGVCMSRADMYPEAVTFFRAANTLNPYHRNALANLSRVLLETNKPWEALPFAERAIQLEPNDPDNLQLLVQNYAAVVKASQSTLNAAKRPVPGSRTGAKTTTPPRPTVTLTAAQTDSLNRIIKAYTDSALSLNQQRTDLKYKVELSNFTVDTASATLGGSVVNQSDASTPITLHVDFLDSTGKVISSKDETLTPAPHGRARFSVKATPGTGVSAFRYTIK
jgi:tetratricopeptide (TPR) repeat protein